MSMNTKLLIPIGLIAAGIIGLTANRTFAVGGKYSAIKPWIPYILYYSKKYNVDPYFVASIMYQESRGNPNAVSSTGAIGLMQVMPSTAYKVCGYTQQDLFNPEKNIECGVKYIARLYKMTGNYNYVAAKYYGGLRATPTSTYGKPPVYHYVNSVNSHYLAIRGYAEGITV